MSDNLGCLILGHKPHWDTWDGQHHHAHCTSCGAESRWNPISEASNEYQWDWLPVSSEATIAPNLKANTNHETKDRGRRP